MTVEVAFLRRVVGRGDRRTSQIGSPVRLICMTIRSIALFVHLVGVLTLFTALAVERVAVELLRATGGQNPPTVAMRLLRGLPRFTGAAVALILLSGIPMAARLGVLRSAWVLVPVVAMILMAVLGNSALRPLFRSTSSGGTSGGWRVQVSRPFLDVSLRMRIGVALGIVYLMVAKPDVFVSIAVVSLGLAAGAAARVVSGPTPLPPTSTEEASRTV